MKNSADRIGVLIDKLSASNGVERAAIAEGFFEHVYGCASLTFLEHVTAYRG